MSWWGMSQFVFIFGLFLMAIPWTVYLSVKLAAFGWHRGKDIYLESRRLKEWRRNESRERSESE